jgi:DNA processing protein
LLEIDPRLAVAAGDPPASGVLDPRSADAQRLALLDAWLRLQSTLCLHPVEALAHLQRSAGCPIRALAESRRERPHDEATLAGWPERLARRGLVALPITSALYPTALRALGDPAPLLLVEGRAERLGQRGVAIVGARAATRFGIALARDLGRGLAEAGLVVVSGMARGIDAAAHRGALEAGGPTVAVLGCGPDLTYPAEHRGLRAEIADAGAVISELPPGQPPLPFLFPLRNRLISGLVEIVVVVEARPRSGSLITARLALDQGRTVMAVPGALSSPVSAGPNGLLRDGAPPVLELRDILDRLGVQAALAQPRRPTLDPEAVALLAELAAEPATRAELAGRADESTRLLSLRLLELELEGLIVEDRDGRIRPAPAALGLTEPDGEQGG